MEKRRDGFDIARGKRRAERFRACGSDGLAVERGVRLDRGPAARDGHHERKGKLNRWKRAIEDVACAHVERGARIEKEGDVRAHAASDLDHARIKRINSPALGERPQRGARVRRGASETGALGNAAAHGNTHVRAATERLGEKRRRTPDPGPLGRDLKRRREGHVKGGGVLHLDDVAERDGHHHGVDAVIPTRVLLGMYAEVKVDLAGCRDDRAPHGQPTRRRARRSRRGARRTRGRRARRCR